VNFDSLEFTGTEATRRGQEFQAYHAAGKGGTTVKKFGGSGRRPTPERAAGVLKQRYGSEPTAQGLSKVKTSVKSKFTIPAALKFDFYKMVQVNAGADWLLCPSVTAPSWRAIFRAENRVNNMSLVSRASRVSPSSTWLYQPPAGLENQEGPERSPAAPFDGESRRIFH